MLKVKGWEEQLCTLVFGLQLPAHVHAYGSEMELDSQLGDALLSEFPMQLVTLFLFVLDS